MKGKICWFSESQGYGFLESDGKDYFIHKSAIQTSKILKKGDRVVFEPGQSQRGLLATQVRLEEA